VSARKRAANPEESNLEILGEEGEEGTKIPIPGGATKWGFAKSHQIFRVSMCVSTFYSKFRVLL
jgi:hypothetical protein